MLEAVIIATVMLSAVAFVATFEQPPAGTTAARSILQQQAQDALAILYDTPASSSLGQNLLSVLLAKCLQGNCTDLAEHLDGLLPAGSSYALYLSNGYDTFPVYVTKGPPGEAITARQLIEPRWSYTFTSAAMSNVNARSDPALIYSLPVFNSNVISPGGSPLKVVVTGTRMSDGADYVLEGFYTTQALASVDAQKEPVVSLNFLVNRTTYEPAGTDLDTGHAPGSDHGYYPGTVWNRYDEVMDANGRPTQADPGVTFVLRVDVDPAGAKLPAGTELTVDVPRGWNASGWNNATWTVLKNATDWNATYNASQIVARLNTEVDPAQTDHVDFAFNGTYRGDLLKYYTFHASLARGANAEANVVVIADGWGDQSQTYFVPSVKMSVPRPMGATATTTWGLSVVIPYQAESGLAISKDGATQQSQPRANVSPHVQSDPNAPPGAAADYDVSAGSPIKISQIDIIEQDGAPIFQDVQPGRLGQGVGSWSVVDHHILRWTGEHDSWSGPLNLTFAVTGSGEAGNAASRQAIVPPVDFDIWQGRMFDSIGPGLYRQAVLPNGTTGDGYTVPLGGYDGSPVDEHTALQHDYTSNSAYRGVPVPGRSNYTANPLSPIHDSIFGSNVEVDHRSVPIGGQIVVTADVQSLLFALSEAGESAGMNITFYPPWTGDDHVPIWQQSNLESSIVASNFAAITMLDMDQDGYPDPIIGTDQGSVFGFDAVTGTRLQGNVWSAPVLSGAGVAAVKAVSTIRIGTTDYIVVGADQNSGVYIVDKDFLTRWSWDKPSYDQADTVAIDTSTDFNGDGQRDVAVALSDSTVWILNASSNGVLEPMPLGSLSPFYATQGTPSAFLATSALGQHGRPGFVVSLLNKPGPMSQVTLTGQNPVQQLADNPPQFYVNLPKAGLDAVDSTGALLWRFGAGPVNVARDAGDVDADGSHDILAGSSEGFVTLLNGQKGVGPMSGATLGGVSKVVDGKAATIQDSVMVTLDGTVYMTDDRWNTAFCVGCDASGQVTHVDNRLTGVSINNTQSVWMVGLLGAMYRSTSELAGQDVGQKQALPVTPTVLIDGVPIDVPASPRNYNDVQFRFGDKPIGDHGWVVGSPTLTCGLPFPLDSVCDEGLVMYTDDGGVTWHQQTHDGTAHDLVGADGLAVHANLTRINFTTTTEGWIVGEHGTLLRTLDGGAHWRGVAIPTTADVIDISCAPLVPTDCYVAGAGGYLWHSTNADRDDGTHSVAPTWTNVTTTLPADLQTAGRSIRSIGAVTPTQTYLAVTNAVLATWNGGRNWSQLPMGYIPSDTSRLDLFPDGSGYGWGGNPTNGEQFTFSAYAGNASYQTIDLTDPTTILTNDPSPTITRVDLTVQTSTTESARLEWNVSADGGSHWTPALDQSVPTVTAVPNPASSAIDVQLGYKRATIPQAYVGHDLKINATWNTTADISLQTAQVFGTIHADVTYTSPTCPAGCTASLPDIDLKVDDKADADHTTISWDAVLGTLAAPLVDKSWSTNVSGSVQDVQTGFDVTGDANGHGGIDGGLDGRADVWASTGPVLAGSSPDYIEYAGAQSPDAFVRDDDRIYLLDGATGAIVRSSAQLPGTVQTIRVADQDGDGWPDVLYALVHNATTGASYTWGFDPANLTRLAAPGGAPWHREFGTSTPAGLEVGRNPHGVMAYVPQGLQTDPASESAFESVLYAVNKARQNGDSWAAHADARGKYEITKQIPTNWFFGPYVAEITVDWRERVTSTDTGTAVPYDVLQSARFYDYFMVTPPDALSPASPIYDVQLVSWFNDWR